MVQLNLLDAPRGLDLPPGIGKALHFQFITVRLIRVKVINLESLVQSRRAVSPHAQLVPPRKNLVYVIGNERDRGRAKNLALAEADKAGLAKPKNHAAPLIQGQGKAKPRIELADDIKARGGKENDTLVHDSRLETKFATTLGG